jgi:hypothetical protein
MGTLTAQILVGSPHVNHDGVQPKNYLFLSENSMPAWILIPQNVFGEHITTKRITWIPSVENMLEDAFLMIAVHIINNSEIIELAKSFYDKIQQTDRLELYECFNDSQRKQLYEKCRHISKFPKVIISVFRHSTIQKQLKVIEQYKMDVEVCCPIYSRLYSAWTKETSVEGSL